MLRDECCTLSSRNVPFCVMYRVPPPSWWFASSPSVQVVKPPPTQSTITPVWPKLTKPFSSIASTQRSLALTKWPVQWQSTTGGVSALSLATPDEYLNAEPVISPGNTCYKLTDSAMSWREARRKCWSWGGELAFPLDQESPECSWPIFSNTEEEVFNYEKCFGFNVWT